MAQTFPGRGSGPFVRSRPGELFWDKTIWVSRGNPLTNFLGRWIIIAVLCPNARELTGSDTKKNLLHLWAICLKVSLAMCLHEYGVFEKARWAGWYGSNLGTAGECVV